MKLLNISSLMLAVVAVLVSACHSGWDKDPFTNKDGNVKNAVPQGGNKIKSPPIQDVMRLDVDPTYVMKEGQKRIITINERLLNDEFKFIDITIPNLDSELPGATFDEATHELTFETEEGYVPEGSVVFSSIVRISLFAEYKGLIQEVREEVVFHVLRGNAAEPEIRQVTGLETSYKEGDVKTFTVRIYDEASPAGPILSIYNDTTAQSNGAQFLEYRRQGRRVPGEPGLYEFTIKVDLDEEITTSSERVGFYMQAFSAFGEPSNTRSAGFRVYTNATRPEYYGTNKIEATAETPASLGFAFGVPSREGRLQAQFKTNCASVLGTGVRCSCQSFGIDNSVKCSIDGTPTNVGNHQIEVEVSNTANVSTTFEDKKTFVQRIQFQVNDAPTPPKCVEPTPDPTEPDPMNEEA